jgi:hemin uptake protein HemP
MSVALASTAAQSHITLHSADRARESLHSALEPLRSEDLLQGQAYVTLVHHGMRYILRQTRQGKLILTK